MLDIIEDFLGLIAQVIGYPVRPAPDPVRVRTAEEQREYDQCNVTLYDGRPRRVTYTITVKPDRH
ncbi:MAG: hypothetical protein WC813_04975 [Patescibacteria group bacterium]|jgi:hypothetical protein